MMRLPAESYVHIISTLCSLLTLLIYIQTYIYIQSSNGFRTFNDNNAVHGVPFAGMGPEVASAYLAQQQQIMWKLHFSDQAACSKCPASVKTCRNSLNFSSRCSSNSSKCNSNSSNITIMNSSSNSKGAWACNSWPHYPLDSAGINQTCVSGVLVLVCCCLVLLLVFNWLFMFKS